jgi:hypothetical protein
MVPTKSNMKKMQKLFLIIILNLCSIPAFSQQPILFLKNNKCDTTIKFIDSIKVEIGIITCIDLVPNNVLYFTKKEEFHEFALKNKITRGTYCLDKQEMTFDFDKYDVVLFMVGFGCQSISFKTIEKNDCYVINLNFFHKEKYEPEDEGKEFQCNAVYNIYSRYVLLPKGKRKVPEFNYYITFYKCF